eukprot:CAMPEP_0116887460 /NCGR_PEP_ID=MMETSP0463-20121206/21953_1 /TAXON_ID=181622 /ORGANISM="Strombidinopsis sp, Strain SopsisLIS2011" /LENGTH=124 /DNA_ID=CAMNT_0004550189 /DNA_START=1020 /DNA_END=1394 /DNA_ORIENTATION=+
MNKAKQLAAMFKGEVLSQKIASLSKNIEFRCCNGHKISHAPSDLDKPIKELIWCTRCLKFYQAAVQAAYRSNLIILDGLYRKELTIQCKSSKHLFNLKFGKKLQNLSCYVCVREQKEQWKQQLK